MKVKLLLAACLAVGEAGVLLGVSYHKLDLVAQSVVPGNLLGWLGGVGPSEDYLFLSVWTDQ
ncbi:hypothetical protein GGP52_002981 [Salinibacter ruber]|nr:hypothetical protein [Salinibacter ruber]